jgi:hypothetical protein
MRGGRTAGRRRRCWKGKDIREEVGLTINDLSLSYPDRGSILIPFLPPLVPLPCLASLARPREQSNNVEGLNKIADVINNAVIQQHILSAPTSPSHIIMIPLILPLRCPICPSHSTLTAPVTLYCGHTVCAIHVAHPPSSSSSTQPLLLRLTPCPLRACTASPAAPSPLNIPPSSNVTVFPALGHDEPDAASAFATIPDSRVDVTVNNLATIIHRYDQQLQAHTPQHLPRVDSGCGSDSETDEEILDARDSSPTPGSSANTGEGPSIPRQVSSDGSQQRPARTSARKRRRKRLPPPRRLDAPAQSADQFEKELLAELSCEICLALYYQPITSPCQHVSRSSSLILIPVDSVCQTFCTKCLHRSLDHSNQCPLCRQTLPGFSYFQDHPFNKTILSISMLFHPFFLFDLTRSPSSQNLSRSLL